MLGTRGTDRANPFPESAVRVKLLKARADSERSNHDERTAEANAGANGVRGHYAGLWRDGAARRAGRAGDFRHGG
jgi:hypothetical protein